MTNLETLHKQITKEQIRIELLKNTRFIDADFLRSEIKTAKNKIEELQTEFDKEYLNQNN